MFYDVSHYFLLLYSIIHYCHFNALNEMNILYFLFTKNKINKLIKKHYFKKNAFIYLQIIKKLPNFFRYIQFIHFYHLIIFSIQKVKFKIIPLIILFFLRVPYKIFFLNNNYTLFLSISSEYYFLSF